MTQLPSISLFAAGAITAFIGASHFGFPRIFGWLTCMKYSPPEFRRGVLSTNFFFSLVLSFCGIFTIGMSLLPAESPRLQLIWLILMNLLAGGRVAYQLVLPQGKQIAIRGLATAVLVLYLALELFFALPLAWRIGVGL